MKEAVLVLSRWVHLLAAVIWIGGIAAILLVVLPSSKKVLGGETPKLMGEVSRRFTPMANVSIGLLIVTGIVMLLTNQFSGLGEENNVWAGPLGLKLLLVSVMFLIHFYRNLILIPKIARISSVSSKASLQKLSLNMVKVNFVIALAVLLLSSMHGVI